jgi:hypothetical protein
MTLPISEQLRKVEYLNGPPNDFGYAPRIYEAERKWYRQKPPYSLPLDFEYYARRVTEQSAYGLYGVDKTWYVETNGIPTYMEPDAALYNAAYQKFREEIGERVEGGMLFVEGKQSMEMVTNRLQQLATFTRQLSRGQVQKAAATLRVSLSSRQAKRMEGRTRKGASGFADNYLEFHFGWSPLLGDIYSGAKALCRPISPHLISVKKTGSRTYSEPFGGSNATERWSGWDAYEIKQSVTLRGSIRVFNPNLALMEQCGLLNPLTIAWERVPFSFVVDWFVNVGDFLGQFTDFAGLTIELPHRTYFTSWRHTHVDKTEYNYTNPVAASAPTYYPFQRYTGGHRYVRTLVSCRRIVGTFPGPTLAIRDPWVLSPRRGLAAASLLIQTLKR